jgi:hypothetical protein
MPADRANVMSGLTGGAAQVPMSAHEHRVDGPVGAPVRLLLQPLDTHQVPAVGPMNAAVLRRVQSDVARDRSRHSRHRRVSADTDLVLDVEPRRVAVLGTTARLHRQLCEVAPLHESEDTAAQSGQSDWFVPLSRGAR